MSTENIDRLPKWAQSRINNLERDLRDVETSLREQYSTEPTTVAIKDFVRGGHPLPNGTAIEFSLVPDVDTEESHTAVIVRHTDDGEGLELYLSGRGAYHNLSVTARSTNVFVVRAATGL